MLYLLFLFSSLIVITCNKNNPDIMSLMAGSKVGKKNSIISTGMIEVSGVYDTYTLQKMDSICKNYASIYIWLNFV
jgi:hypothetical protein